MVSRTALHPSNVSVNWGSSRTPSSDVLPPDVNFVKIIVLAPAEGKGQLLKCRDRGGSGWDSVSVQI